METREQRQARIDAKVAELRARADAKEAESNRLRGSVDDDSTFWTQPAYGNAAGRAFAARRERERSKIVKAGNLYMEAKALRETADSMEARGARMAGDAAAEREAAIAAADFKVGQMVRTLYGVRKVVKVNRKSILIEGGMSPVSVPKHLAEAV
ncbi:hypothetical protein [Pelagibacterium sp. H642]|uniref:hypothetical protein n=1 Tax=Pelagibacterium sp. H642 TaxID=1881069 RepID=UPI0028156EA4|nr:hypothetical protein [Pelagibacterium sp. H642]WMT90104.1 hypothetical protein NO934_15095 [Pelagibacterium sp. H642]